MLFWKSANWSQRLQDCPEFEGKGINGIKPRLDTLLVGHYPQALGLKTNFENSGLVKPLPAMKILATEFSDLNLRPLTRKDSDALFRLTESNRHYLRRWLPWLDFTRTLADTRNFVRGSIGRREAGLGLDYGVFLQSEIVGVITFNTLSRLHRNGTIGYWLAELYTRRGFMTASVRRLIDYGFGDLNLNRIEIRVAVGNQPSQAICDRLGLKQEGILRQAEWLYDRFVDLRVNSVLRSEWKG